MRHLHLLRGVTSVENKHMYTYCQQKGVRDVRSPNQEDMLLIELQFVINLNTIFVVKKVDPYAEIMIAQFY